MASETTKDIPSLRSPKSSTATSEQTIHSLPKNMTRDAFEDLKELRTLHHYCLNPKIKFKSVYRRTPAPIASAIYDMEQTLRDSLGRSAQIYA